MQKGRRTPCKVDLPEGVKQIQTSTYPDRAGGAVSQAVEAHHSTWELAKADRPGRVAP